MRLRNYSLGGARCNLSVMLLTIEVIGCTIIIPRVNGSVEKSRDGGGREAEGVAIMNAFTARGAAREKTLIIPDNIAGVIQVANYRCTLGSARA